MNIRSICSTVLFSSLLVLVLHAQTQAQSCGTQLTDVSNIDPTEITHYRDQHRNQRDGEKINVGITVHIVEQVAGAANIELEQLYSELDAVNQIFNASGIQFFFCGSPRTIVGGRSIYSYVQAADLLNKPYHIAGTINIFYLDEIGDQQTSEFACGISTFPFNSNPENRFIIMQKDCSTNGSTLAHEIGHFFGLLHTHETAVGIEYVNGSNCQEAGDLICDTPADPNLAFTGLSGCTYTAQYTDPNGDLYTPDPSNIMSYAPSGCRRKFTEDQNITMNYWYETELTYLVSECNQYPDYSISSDIVEINIPSGHDIEFDLTFDDMGSNTANKVPIEVLMRAADSEISYTIYRDSVLFTGDIGAFMENFQVAVPLNSSSGEYQLTIILDPAGTILETDKRNNIFFITLMIDNSSLADFTVFPNPADQYVQLFFRDKNTTGKTHVEISDVIGRLYRTKDLFKNNEEFFTEFDLNDVPPGLYVITLSFAKTGTRQSRLFLKE